MYVYRERAGKKEFFILHRKRNDVVTLTGHVADRKEIKGESIEEAARRETIEELGVEPISIIDLEISAEVEMEERGEDIVSVEHAFLIQIPDKDVHFLEGDERHEWYPIEELSEVLTYPNQKIPLKKISQIISS